MTENTEKAENLEEQEQGYPFGAELPVVAQDGEGDTELAPPVQHAPGGLVVPDNYGVLEGSPNGARRGVAVVVARFNGDVTTRLLESALAELERAGVGKDVITVVPVPGAFELPIQTEPNHENARYLATKREKLGHKLHHQDVRFDPQPEGE